ncbi:MAG: helix-turn-helix domain-containing protein [Planctomycetaceae bacterium]
MYLTVQDVAKQLRISPSSVYLLVESGQLAHVRIGARRGAIRISEEDLTEYLTEHHQGRSTERATPLPVTRVTLKHIKL